MPETSPPRPRRGLPRRGRRALAWAAGILGATLLLGVIGVAIWSQVGVMAAEPAAVAAVRENSAVSVTETDSAVVLAPASGESVVGLVFIPGAKVDPWAYAAKLSGVVERGVTVVVTRPWLNLAFFDLRPLSAFTAAAPGVETWIVGGHSLGGVKACQLAGDADALALFASYCANDLADSGLAVLSVGGSEDLLTTPDDIAAARALLPTDAEVVEIAGASHSSFGDYGIQPGDGRPSISDPAMTERLSELVGALAQAVAR